jgi:hypothetical protein
METFNQQREFLRVVKFHHFIPFLVSESSLMPCISLPIISPNTPPLTQKLRVRLLTNSLRPLQRWTLL